MIDLEIRLQNLENSFNNLTYIINNMIPKNTEISEVVRSIDEQMLEIKQKIFSFKQNLAIVERKLD